MLHELGFLIISHIQDIPDRKMTVIAPNNSQGGKRMWPSEEEKLARIKLETRLAPRHITQEQQNRIAEKLAEFKGTQVAFGVKPSTDESHWLMRWLASPFGMAGWKVEMNVNPAEMKIHAGIMVETTKNPQAIIIANKVVEALQAEGLKAGTVPILNLTTPVADPLRLLIVIGSKESTLDFIPSK